MKVAHEVIVEDGTAGFAVFEDHTLAQWSEGRSSSVVLYFKDGSVLEVPVWVEHPYVDALIHAQEAGEHPVSIQLP